MLVILPINNVMKQFSDEDQYQHSHCVLLCCFSEGLVLLFMLYVLAAVCW